MSRIKWKWKLWSEKITVSLIYLCFFSSHKATIIWVLIFFFSNKAKLTSERIQSHDSCLKRYENKKLIYEFNSLNNKMKYQLKTCSFLHEMVKIFNGSKKNWQPLICLSCLSFTNERFRRIFFFINEQMNENDAGIFFTSSDRCCQMGRKWQCYGVNILLTNCEREQSQLNRHEYDVRYY